MGSVKATTILTNTVAIANDKAHLPLCSEAEKRSVEAPCSTDLIFPSLHMSREKSSGLA